MKKKEFLKLRDADTATKIFTVVTAVMASAPRILAILAKLQYKGLLKRIIDFGSRKPDYSKEEYESFAEAFTVEEQNFILKRIEKNSKLFYKAAYLIMAIDPDCYGDTYEEAQEEIEEALKEFKDMKLKLKKYNDANIEKTCETKKETSQQESLF